MNVNRNSDISPLRSTLAWAGTDLIEPCAATGRVVGRFAPSPTGPLHFGSLLAAVASYCVARRSGGDWLLRMDDLDGPRVVEGAADAILCTLEGLGFAWDGPVLWQSRRSQAYQAALGQLQAQGLLYDCACTRREILASAPHPGEEGPVYPGTCRDGMPPGRPARAVRIRVPEGGVAFTDGVFGLQAQDLAREVGDFVLRRADGLFAYQLATVVDDAASGVNQVVRGADLLSSTARQVFLCASLGLAAPDYLHVPLAVAADGSKISKRQGTALDPGAWTGGGPVARALRWLGQPLPGELDGAPPGEVLAWGAANFSVGLIPRRRQIAVDSAGESR